MDPADQGLRDEFDVVIATNVLHATRDLHATLRHTKRLLRPGGALVLNESVEVQEYSTYTFGLLPGWWNASDPHERLADSPLASASRWPALLRDEGFAQVRALVPADSAAAAVRAQQVYVAFSDGELRAAGGKTPAPRRAGARCRTDCRRRWPTSCAPSRPPRPHARSTSRPSRIIATTSGCF